MREIKVKWIAERRAYAVAVLERDEQDKFYLMSKSEIEEQSDLFGIPVEWITQEVQPNE